MNTFIEDVIKNVEGVNNGTCTGNKEWTIAIKKALIDVAEKHNLSVNCKIPEQYKNNENIGWVYDIIIYSWNDNIFDEVYLAGESEWSLNYGDIEYDFLKLLFARSKVRLLVYQVSEENYNEYKNKLINIIEKSRSCQKGDIYLFAIYNITTDEFKVEKFEKV
jgi:hypothetical protein